MTAKKENVYAELDKLRRMINWLQDDVLKLQHRLAALEGKDNVIVVPAPQPQNWWPPGWDVTPPTYLPPVVYGRQ